MTSWAERVSMSEQWNLQESGEQVGVHVPLWGFGGGHC
jgi:hypothetical protein